MTNEIIIGIMAISISIISIMLAFTKVMSKSIRKENNPTWDEIFDGWEKGNFIDYLKDNFNPPTPKE